jgi:hypothetical protein
VSERLDRIRICQYMSSSHDRAQTLHKGRTHDQDLTTALTRALTLLGDASSLQQLRESTVG